DCGGYREPSLSRGVQADEDGGRDLEDPLRTRESRPGARGGGRDEDETDATQRAGDAQNRTTAGCDCGQGDEEAPRRGEGEDISLRERPGRERHLESRRPVDLPRASNAGGGGSDEGGPEAAQVQGSKVEHEKVERSDGKVSGLRQDRTSRDGREVRQPLRQLCERQSGAPARRGRKRSQGADNLDRSRRGREGT